MIKSRDFSGKNEEEAIQSALNELGLDRDEVSVELIERAKSGFLGIGASPAVVRVSYEAPDEAPLPKAESSVVTRAAVSTAAAASVELTGEQGEVRDRAEEFLRGLLGHMGAQADIITKPREGGGLSIDLRGEGMGLIIGRRGETLDAIQHLTNYAVNRAADKRVHINVDAENYRAKREDSLIKLAEKMAGKVIKYKKSMALEPMNSYERHVIHTALQNFEGVTTGSTGTEPNRRVVVSYAARTGAKKPQTREWS